MDLTLAMRLRNALQEACPVDTGQLRLHIQPAQGSESCWVITIGQANGEINGTPSNVYASITNNARTIKMKNRSYNNPNYHWVNKAIEKWARENSVQIAMGSEDDEDE